MDRTISTFSQTPRTTYPKRMSMTKSPIESPKLKKTFERIQAEHDLQVLQNRIEKLIKIDSTLNREIFFTHEKSEYFKSLQKKNMTYVQQKQAHKAKTLTSIESKRRSLSISRQEQRIKREQAFEQSLNVRKSKAHLVKTLRNSWDKSYKERKSEELNRKIQFARRVKEIEKKNKELRCQSQASQRKIVEKLYRNSICEQEAIAVDLRKETEYLAELEEKFVEKLSNTINIRNNQLNGLNNLMAISKLPLSQRSN